ncbi:sensor domain-containing protein [Chromobacterium haemolyticum]|uniref:sensor domain-containing protein n=1 Tax=Chromobacterium haemolyticum TaxID=394935 RepID=UPI001FFFA830|nr:EAL domain-containing protein [Chromobacterium haemolyticum]
MFLGFLACTAFWPREPVLGFSLAAFLAHGVWSYRLLRRGWRQSWWWPLAAAALAAQWSSPQWAALLLISLYALVPGLYAAGLRGGLAVRQPADLLRLLLRLACYPSVLLAGLAAGAGWRWFGMEGLWSWAAQAWGVSGLALSLCVPAALYASGATPTRRQVLETGLILALACVAWLSLLGSSLAYSLPCQLVFFPLMLWAAFRVGFRGAALVGAWVLGLLSLYVLAPELTMHASVLNGASEVALTLALSCATLLVSVLADGHRQNESALREFRARVESLVNNSPNMMSLKGLDGRFLLANAAYARRVGRSPQGMQGLTVEELFDAADAAQIRAQDAVVLSCLEPRQFEESFLFNGVLSHLLVTKFPLFDAHGRPAGVGSVDTDITQTRQEQKAKRETEERYRALVEQSLVGIYILQDEKLIYANPKLAAIVGYQPKELEGMPMDLLLVPGEAVRIRQQIVKRYRENIAVLQYGTRAVRKDGVVVDVEIHSRLFDYEGKKAIIGVVMDISERLAADANLRLAAKVFENSAEGILLMDAEARIIAVNHAFSRITGYAEDEALGKVSRIFGDQKQLGRQAMLEALADRGHWQGEMQDRRKSGEWYPAELAISAVRDAGGALSNYVAVFSDITLRKQSEERLQFLANHDPLTQLPNRSSLTARLDEAIISLDCASGSLAVMFIDLDRFKLINDSFGHQAGDELLRETALRLQRAVGARGLLARLGGDEFTLVMTGFKDAAALVAAAEDTLAALGQPLRLENHEVYVTGSIGISVYPNDGTDAQTLLKNADVAMYRAKEAGKNTYQFFAAEMNTQTFERLLLENGLRLALERGELELHYQPQVDAVSRRVLGAEALIRWRHPQLGLVPPGRFIPLAEETGLIKPIGDWVLQEACRQLAAWDRQGLTVPRLAVNLSARQFEQQMLPFKVADALRAAGLSAARLELEITESMIMLNPVEAVRQLGELKALGVGLSIDDFGTGYSSLSNLKRFPLDTLKIDQSFVEGLPDDGDNAAIAEAILAMARKLQFQVVAEGVESERQAQFLTSKGCALLQGYHFGRPVPAAELPALLAGIVAVGEQRQLELMSGVEVLGS